MKLAACLYKFFPYGGLSRDFLRIMEATLQPEDELDVYVKEWQGEIPRGFNVRVLTSKGHTNHARLSSYQKTLKPILDSGNYDLIIGFNKMPGLDLYYAADPCYLDRIQSHPLYNLLKYTGRVRFFSECERSVFGEHSHTVSLMISDVQQRLFQKQYKTQPDRLITLPPGIDPDRKRPENADSVRHKLRKDLGIQEHEWMILMVGTAFHTKGVDRAIAALSELPTQLKRQTRLIIVGDGEDRALMKQAEKLGVDAHVNFLGGRKDVSKILLAADLLLHPARKENTGTVILEALVAGLPVLVSDVCGYTKHVVAAKAGKVMQKPDNSVISAKDISHMLDKVSLKKWSENALKYAATEDLYSMPKQAANIIRELVKQKKGKLVQ